MSALQLLLYAQQISLYATMVHHVIIRGQGWRGGSGHSREAGAPRVPKKVPGGPPSTCPAGVGAATRGVVLRYEQLGGRGSAVGADATIGAVDGARAAG